MTRTISCLIFLLLSALCHPQETIKIAFVVPKNSTAFKFGSQLIHEISKKMGRKISLKYYPAHRSEKLLKRGLIHADIARIYSFQKRTPSAILIKEPLITLPYYAYSSMTKTFKVNGWQSLKPYSIVTIRGFHSTDQYLKQHNTHDVDSQIAAFKFLKMKRAQLFVENDLWANPILNLDSFDSQGITKLEPPVDYIKSYSFFSANYPKLALQYAKALKEIQDSGVFDQIMNGTYQDKN